MTSIVVVSAGLGRPSTSRLLADRLAAATVRALGQSSGLVGPPDLRVVELRDLAHDLTDTLLTGFAPPALSEVLDAVRHADGLILVTPIFTASYSGLFKTFMDVLEPDSLVDLPVLVAATGGTARHSLALEFAVRPLLAYLRAAVVPTAVFAATADWGDGHPGQGGPGQVGAAGIGDDTATGSPITGLAGRIDRAGRELAQAVLASTRPAPVDEPDVIPFERLLAGD